ncbi:MAG: sigma 54-interacting transcriptional regulator [Planctomycetota bacterium]|nr:sigma 54-interacting transcriptional regulator [Planctomycetota bacterium]
MKRLLISWVGRTDLRAPKEEEVVGKGPIAQALDAGSYDAVVLISDYPRKEVAPFLEWLQPRTKAEVTVLYESLSGPTNFGEIYKVATRVVAQALERCGGDVELAFHLSPGTPAMASVWIILAKTRFPAELIESSLHHGVRTASVPFDISAEFIPDLLRGPDERLEKLTAGLPPDAPEFADIVHRSRVMARVIAKARRVAPRSITVLIEGESGTGKELLARAIHRASPRRDKPFKAVNCGAIPSELAESELFGHEKGAFTGAHKTKVGYFEAADGGTLFLDEIAELSLPAQVKLLRVLQDGEVLRVGSTNLLKVDVRIIAATNRTLSEEIAAGRFREDLFYRLAVAALRLPPLRERSGDMGLLLDRLLEQVNLEHAQEPGYERKILSAGARNLLLLHPWPGNVRELLNTLHRAALWTSGSSMRIEDAREALLPAAGREVSRILDRPLGDELSLPDLLATVVRHYLTRALDETRGNKTLAARLVGLSGYQTLTNWLNKYGVKR